MSSTRRVRYSYPERLRRVHHKKEYRAKRISRSLASARAHALLALVASSTKYTRPLNGTPSEWFDSDISHVRDVE